MTAHSKEPTTPLASRVTPPPVADPPPEPPALEKPLLAVPPKPRPVFGGWSHVPSMRVVSVYCGFVACCRRWNARLDPTAIWSPWGTDEMGSSHENSSAGPWY